MIRIAAIVVFVASVFLALRAAQWLGGKKAVLVLGAAMAGLIAFAMFDTLRVCGADPIIVPSSGGGERAVFECDGPAGAFIYGFAYLVCPVAAACVGALTLLVARRPQRINQEA